MDVEGGEGVISEGVIWDGVGDGYRLWSIEVWKGRTRVRKRVSSHIHIDMLHLLCTSLTPSSKYCTHER